MKRKMVYAGTAWAAGLTAAAMSVKLPAVFIALIVIAFLFKTAFRFNLKSIIFMFTAFTMAFGYFKLYDSNVYGNITAFENSIVHYSGTVTRYNDNADNRSVYYLDGKINGKQNAKLILQHETLICETGDTLEFDCTINVPENNFLFNGRDYHKSKGFYIQTDSAENMSIIHNNFSVLKMFSDYRESVSTTVNRSVPLKEAGMIKGMLFGDKSGIEDDDMTMLYRVGIGHVTAVSGLHIVLFSTLVSVVLRKLKTRKIIEFVITETFMLLFAVCCGMSPSIMRAFVMMTLVNSAPLFFRYTDSLNSICIAVILLTIPDPFMIINQSFILSVSGALGAGVFAPYMTRHMSEENFIRKWIKNLLYMICVSIAVTPMSIICFGEVSLVAPLSNLFITPLCMVALLFSMLGALLIFINPTILFEISAVFCRIVLRLSEKIGSNRFTHTKLSGEFVYMLLIMLMVFCIITFLTFSNRKYTAISVLVSVVTFFVSCTCYDIYDSRILKVALLGKNHAGVIVVLQGNNADIIDINGKYKNSRYVSKYLGNMGITKINNIIITQKIHNSLSAYNSELSLYDVGNVVIPEETYVRHDSKICGVIPKYSDFSGWSAAYSDYSIKIEEKCIAIDFGGFHFESDDGKYEDKKYKTNIVLYAKADGTFDYRRLEDG